jgi:hypothetical protein
LYFSTIFRLPADRCLLPNWLWMLLHPWGRMYGYPLHEATASGGHRSRTAPQLLQYPGRKVFGHNLDLRQWFWFWFFIWFLSGFVSDISDLSDVSILLKKLFLSTTGLAIVPIVVCSRITVKKFLFTFYQPCE